MELSCPLGIRALSRKENLSCFGVLSYNKYFIIIDQACSVKMAGYWPSSFLRVYGPRLRPHAWSITHTYYMVLSHKDWELPNSRI